MEELTGDGPDPAPPPPNLSSAAQKFSRLPERPPHRTIRWGRLALRWIGPLTLLVIIGLVKFWPSGTTSAPSASTGSGSPVTVVQPPAPAAVTYATDPIKRGKQCLAAGVKTSPMTATAGDAYTSWLDNLRAAQAAKNVDQLSCAFLYIDSTLGSTDLWSQYKTFSPATIIGVGPSYFGGDATAGIVVDLVGDFPFQDGSTKKFDVTLRWSAAASPGETKGVWMVSDMTPFPQS